MKIVYRTAKTLHYIAAAGLLVLMMLQVANMIGRYFFNSPLQGTTDLGSFMLLVIAALGLGWAALERRHIQVGLVMDLLPKRVQLVTDTIMLTICCAVAAFVSYLNIQAGITWPARTSSVLNIPWAPFRYILGGGFAVLAVCALITLMENFRNLGGTKGDGHES